MRKLIAKALQARSKGLKNAITRYNEAATASGRPLLTWQEVVEYGFLADFDLLRLGREDLRDVAWAQPGAREAMDQHFRILQAEVELTRLNLEILQFVTHMTEEERFLVYHGRRLEAEGKPARATQIRAYRMLEGRYSGVHMDRLQKLSKLPGFTGTILPGVGVSEERRVPEGFVMEVSTAVMDEGPSSLTTALESLSEADAHAVEAEADGDDETDDEDLEGLGEAFENIVRITDD